MARVPQGKLLGALHPEDDVPLYRQVHLRVRELILDGTLPRGTRLPSTRALAADLGVSRNTVLLGMELLAAEGYVTARVGDGTYVSHAVPEDRERPVDARHAGDEPTSAPAPELSARGRRIAGAALGRDPTRIRPFAVGMPALDEFPWETWRRLAAQLGRRADPALLGFGDPAGHRPLREEVATYLTTARGVRCRADEVLIVSSSQQALDLAARLLLDPGDAAWMEEPGYLGARGALQAAGAELVPVPVDADGLDVEVGRRRAPDARLAYVTPSHQFPLGATMSLDRRLALLDWAAERRAWILEDDYDSEYRYEGRPLTALQGLDRSRRVVYVGTFTKVAFPSLRLAYVVPPRELVPAFLAARTFVDRHSPTLPQAVLAEFFRRGHFTAHLRRMRSLYERRRAALRSSLEGHGVEGRPATTASTGGPSAAANGGGRRSAADAGGKGTSPQRCRADPERARLRDDPAGMHLVLELPPGTDDREIHARLADDGISCSPLSRYYLGSEPRPGLLLGYTGFGEEEIRDAAVCLAAHLREGPPIRDA